jgi:hypothetical protein
VFYDLPLNASGLGVAIDATLTPLPPADNPPPDPSPDQVYVDVRLRDPSGSTWSYSLQNGTTVRQPAWPDNHLDANVQRYGSAQNFSYTLKV